VLNNLEILVEVILVLKLVFSVYETNGDTGEGDNLDSLSDSQKEKRKSALKPIYFLFKHRVMEVVFDILDGKNTLIFFCSGQTQ